MSNGLKLLLIASGTLITCLIVTVAIYMAKASEHTSNAYICRMDEVCMDIAKSDITMYDGLTLYGSDVVNFIKKQLDTIDVTENSDYVITVVTSLTPYTAYSYQNKKYIESIQNFTDVRYIHPLHKFVGTVTCNVNGVIEEIVFTIQ